MRKNHLGSGRGAPDVLDVELVILLTGKRILRRRGGAEAGHEEMKMSAMIADSVAFGAGIEVFPLVVKDPEERMEPQALPGNRHVPLPLVLQWIFCHKGKLNLRHVSLKVGEVIRQLVALGHPAVTEVAEVCRQVATDHSVLVEEGCLQDRLHSLSIQEALGKPIVHLVNAEDEDVVLG
jgi:hypothetical protein